MEYTIRPSEDQDYIIVKIDGNFTAEDMMKCVLESHKMGMEMGIHAYLVDVTNAKNVDSAMGNYKFAYKDMKMTEGVDRFAKVAGLVSPGDSSHNFVETASSNAGMFLKLFSDRTEATNYLLNR